jgi:hypothetical protein
MNGYLKLTAALAAFALLVVLGLSTQNTVRAQAASISVDSYLCSVATAADAATSTCDAQTDVTLTGSTGDIIVKNLDVAEVTGSNPRTIATGDTLTMVQQFTDDGDDGTPNAGEIRAFTGNRIELTHRPTSGFAVSKMITIDNVDPVLVTNSPNVPLVVKGGVNIAFSADITDSGSGYTGTVGTSGTTDIDDLTGQPGALVAATNGTTPAGGVRLVVAGNVVTLGKSNFSAIDNGWRVSAEIGSTAIQNIGANVPWYFETRDRAGNTRRTSGSIALKPSAATNTSITVGRFIGGLQTNSFDGSTIKVTRGSSTINLSISSFSNTDGVFTVTEPTPVPAPFDTAAVTPDDKFELLGSNLLTIDSKAPTLGSPQAVTGIVYSSSKKMAVRGLSAKANSIQVNFADDSKTDGDMAGSGLNASSVTPAAFSVSNNTVNSVLTQGNSVYLTLASNLAPDAQPSISIASGQIMDKAGNAYGGGRIAKAGDGLGPNLSLSESGDLSKEKVTVTITTDEQLASLPTVTLSRVINSDGDVVNSGAVECVYAAVAADDPTAGDPALPAVTQATEDDGTCEAPSAAGGLDARYNAGDAPDLSPVAGRPDGAPSPSQTAAKSYTYAVTASQSNPTGDDVVGGKYNVYVTGVDTQHAENLGNAGHASDANNAAAFTFQLDTKLNGGGDPTVTVSDATATASSGDAPDVEAVDPMIVTVDWAGEAGEYPGDSYRTVELTSASLKITFGDGSSESHTFNLTTEVSSADNIKYTIPILNPKVGAYALTVKGTDSAGNASGTAGHSASWNVVAAKPVNISLEPGWNLISLPFQPGNPAVNSVIPANHPVDIVMTFDNASQTWMVSRRDAETGLFVGDIVVMTANTAYFVRTDKFQAIRVLRPPLATAAAAPPPPPAIPVVVGWNLVPVVSNEIPTPKTIDADDYFGTLGKDGWLKALTFNTLLRTWSSVEPGETEDADNDSETAETPVQVTVGKGYWLYATKAGVIIP